MPTGTFARGSPLRTSPVAVSTGGGDFKAAWTSCGCIGLVCLFGMAVLGSVVSNNNSAALALGVILGVLWTLGAIWVWVKAGSPRAQELTRWTRQEATRLRKKAWKEGRK